MPPARHDAESLIGGNLFPVIKPGIPDQEEFSTLISLSGVHIQRIVSTGQTSPSGFWYDQPEAEWVALLSGEATLLIEDEPSPRKLKAGDWIHIPSRCRHRVEWTSQDPPAVWLAVHFPGG
jgi:cupin 2 domain-containing protein